MILTICIGVVILGIGFVLGMYFASQIEGSINRNITGDIKTFLHSDEISEWDVIFDPASHKCEYTEEQMIRFAELWVKKTKEPVIWTRN